MAFGRTFMAILLLAVIWAAGAHAEPPSGSSSRLALREFTAGSYLESQGLLEEALERYLKAHIYDPNSSYICLKVSTLSYRLGKSTQAFTFASSAAELDSTNAEAFKAAAKALLVLGRPGDAVEWLKGAVRIEPDDWRARVALGSAYNAVGLDSLATSEFEEAVSRAPGEAAAHYHLGMQAQRMGDTPRAILAFESAAELDPDMKGLLPTLGEAYELEGRLEDARTAYVRSLTRRPRDLEVRARLISVLVDLEDIEGAITQCLTFLRRDPANYQILRVLAGLYAESGRLEDAASALEKAKAVRPSDLNVRFLLGHIWWRLGESEKAIAELSALRESGKNDLEVLVTLGLAYLDADSVGVAVTLLEDAARAYPDSATAHHYLGTVYYESGSYPEAERALLKALALRPNRERSLMALAAVREKMDDLKGAEEAYRSVISINPDNAAAYNNVGYMYVERGLELQRSLEDIKRAVDLDPDNGYYNDSLGWAYFKLGNFNKALTYLSKAVEYSGDVAQIREHLGDVYNELGRFEAAASQYRKALELEPGSESALAKLKRIER